MRPIKDISKKISEKVLSKSYFAVIILFSSVLFQCTTALDESLKPVIVDTVPKDSVVKSKPVDTVKTKPQDTVKTAPKDTVATKPPVVTPTTPSTPATPSTPTTPTTTPATPAAPKPPVVVPTPVTPITPTTPKTPATPVTPKPPVVVPTPPVVVPKPPVISSNATIKGSFSFPVGAAVKSSMFGNPNYMAVLTKHFSSVTAENGMKFASIQKTQGVFTYTEGDAIVALAQQNNMRVHGHCLIWAKDSTMPSWIVNFKGDSTAWDGLLKNHIQNVLKHFKGKVGSWDVVNEAFADNGTLKPNVWLTNLGPDYILKAFKYAHDADPNVKLFYNDYGQEFGYHKVASIVALVNKARAQNIKIDGIGFQMHTILRLSTTGFQDNLTVFAKMGLLLHVSELDLMTSYQQPAGYALTPTLDAAIAKKYKEIFVAYMTAVPKAQQFGITTWGVSDHDSFYNVGSTTIQQYSLLFDKNYAPKAAVSSVIAAGQGK